MTNQDVFTNLSVILPQRYAPITKIAILSLEDLEQASETNVTEKGYEILEGEITVGKKTLNSSKGII